MTKPDKLQQQLNFSAIDCKGYSNFPLF